jgi:hypothetical protein
MTETEATGVGHNSEAMQASLHQHMAEFRMHRSRLAQANEGLKALKKAFKQARNVAKADGWLLKVLDAALDVEDNNDRDAAAEAEQRRFVFEVLALPLGLKNGELFGDNADPGEAVAYWHKQGYSAGLRNDEASPPKKVPPDHHQDWLRGRSEGVERALWAAAARGVNVERKEPTEAADDPLLN